MYKKLLTLILSCLLVQAAAIQAQAQISTFNHWTVENGLSNSNVKSFLRDSRGYLWIGTEAGLNCFDGYQFKHYFHEGDFFSDDIHSLDEDGNGNLWISRYIVFDFNSNYFLNCHEYLSLLGVKTSQYAHHHIDSQGNLWAFQPDGVLLYDFHTRQQRLLQTPLETMSYVTDNGTWLYAITTTGRIYRFAMNTPSLQQMHEVSLPPALVKRITKQVNRLFVGRDNSLWLYSEVNGLLYYKEADENEWHSLGELIKGRRGDNVVTSIACNGREIWVATDHDGIFLFNKEKQLQEHIVRHPDIGVSLLSDGVCALYTDPDNTVWLGYYNAGMSAYRSTHNHFRNFYDPKYKKVSCFVQDKQGALWIGTDGYGLWRQQEGREQQIDLPGNVCTGLTCDYEGRIWAATYTHGLLCYENGKLTRRLHRGNSNISNNYISGLVQDRYGTLWLLFPWGTLQGYHPDTGEFENFYLPQTTHEEAVRGMSLYYDGGDILYAGTFWGVYRLNISTREAERILGNRRGTQEFSGKTIQSVCHDAHGRLWVGTNQGISIWDVQNDSIHYLTRRNGLCDNAVKGIYKDAGGRMWVLTGNGLSVVDVRQGEDARFSINNYYSSDGLISCKFERYAFMEQDNGNILLGTILGYSTVRRDSLTAMNDASNALVLTGLHIGNTEIQPHQPYDDRIILPQPIEQLSTLQFSHRDEYITLEFSPMNLLDARKIKYAYRVEEINTNWMYTSDHKIFFSSLLPGTYHLHIKAFSADGTQEVGNLLVRMRITPPWWRSTVAYLLYALLALLLLLALVYGIRQRNRRRLEQQRAAMERDREEHIKEAKLRFFTNISHDLRTPLTLILTPLQRLLEQSKEDPVREKLQMVYRNAQQLLGMVNQLLDFRKLDLGAETLQTTCGTLDEIIDEVVPIFLDCADEHDIRFEIHHQASGELLQLDFNKIRKVLMNLLSNAFKYTPDGGHIELLTEVEADTLLLTVKDSGCGIPDAEKETVFRRFYQTAQSGEKTGSGIGLHIVSEYVHLHEGTVTLTDNTPCGSIFTCRIPRTDSERKETEPELPATHSDKPTILVVEDNADTLALLKGELEEHYLVATARNGKEAMEVLEDEDINVQLIVSDVMMPVMDGMELLRTVKSNLAWSHIPVILLTARTIDADKLEGLELGADDYITKPFNISLLELRIKKFMEWSDRCHHLFRQKVDVEPQEITITSLDTQLIERAIAIVEEHMKDPNYSVDALSRELGLSRGHLYKKLTCITGKRPLEFIHAVRVKRGRQLLELSGMQVAEIAYAVGYNTPKLFRKYFKEEFGMSPTEYMQNKKQPE